MLLLNGIKTVAEIRIFDFFFLSTFLYLFFTRPVCYTRRFVCTELECLAKKSLVLQCKLDKMAVFYIEK